MQSFLPPTLPTFATSRSETQQSSHVVVLATATNFTQNNTILCSKSASRHRYAFIHGCGQHLDQVVFKPTPSSEHELSNAIE
mmetsp:Transcript_13496/g.19843  ORF Transcript_13496/g.19843 Transcript_13496/m.19843 type:complete len:82 (+) Transcript_13496:216-461(+)